MHNRLTFDQAATEIKEILSWNENTFNNYYVDNAVAWLIYFYKTDANTITALYPCALFWHWWRNYWHKRDLVYLQSVYEAPIKLREFLYRSLHDPYELGRYPHKPVINEMNGLLTGKHKTKSTRKIQPLVKAYFK